MGATNNEGVLVAIQSDLVQIGLPCPSFDLPAVDGAERSLSSYSGSEALLVAFICAHCPYVQAIEQRLIDLPKLFKKEELALVGICSNDSKDYPQDAPKALYERWKSKGYTFDYLVDESQAVARAFGAVCTPDFFLYDSGRSLYYRGRMDDNWKQPDAVRTHDLADAIRALLAGKPAPKTQIPSMGCSIKWRS
jgi:peroxiredoxin